MPELNGGAIGKIPAPNAAVPITEYGWGLKAEELRHRGRINLGFLDGHASPYQKVEFYDLDGRAALPTDNPQDIDAYGTRPFYAWGLTKNGQDFLR